MLEFLSDNNFDKFWWQETGQQTIKISMRIDWPNSWPICSYIHWNQDFYKGYYKKEKLVAQLFNFSFFYIDDVLSLNNPSFKAYLHLIYRNEREMKETTNAQSFGSYIDINLYRDYTERLFRNSYKTGWFWLSHCKLVS